MITNCFLALVAVLCLTACNRNTLDAAIDERPHSMKTREPLGVYVKQCPDLIKLQEIRNDLNSYDLYFDLNSVARENDTATFFMVTNFFSEVNFSEFVTKDGNLFAMHSVLEKHSDTPTTGTRFSAKSNAAFETVNCKTRVMGSSRRSPTHWIGYFGGHCGSGTMAYTKGSGRPMPVITTEAHSSIWEKTNRELFKEAVDRVCGM